MRVVLLIITLVFVNVSYVMIYFNLNSIISESSEEEIEEIILVSNTNNNFSLSDLLDLDILDFDIEELADSSKEDECVFKKSTSHARRSLCDRCFGK